MNTLSAKALEKRRKEKELSQIEPGTASGLDSGGAAAVRKLIPNSAAIKPYS